MLSAFERPGRFWRGNIHGHSNNSDGALDPEEACKRYREAGYDFVSLTDHFLPSYNFPISDTRAYRDNEFTTILGAEVHAPKTSRGVEWHILAVGLPADFEATRADETGVDLARRCAAAGAFVAIPHPHWYQLTLDDALSIDVAHAVEAYNHTSAVNSDRGDGLVMLDDMLNAGCRINTIAVDDSHWHADDAFGGWVMVKAERNDPDLLLQALKDGAFYSSQGPEIHKIEKVGHELEIQCSPASSIILLGSISANRHVHGRSITKARFPLAPFENSWCRLAVIDASGRRAWSNPLWLA